MAKKKKEEVVEKTPEKPIVDNKVEKLTIKKKPKKFASQDDTVKVDLSKQKEEPKEDVVKVDLTENKQIEKEQPVVEEIKEEQPTQEEPKETPIVEEITNEQTQQEAERFLEETKELANDAIETKQELPENIQKLMNFMDDTGGDLTDYVTLNRDYEDLDNDTLLREYYKQTKPHLSEDEIEFIMEDKFSFDVEEDEDKDIKRKKLALKEQVASAKSHLDGLKSKYYEDIKAGSKLTQEQQEAIDFFNRYNKESEESQKIVEKQANTFVNKTNQVFNDKFKGFEYSVGDKKYRFNVNNANEVKDTQSDINNFVKKFLNENNEMSDAKGYHKSLYTAMNADAIANHFYEQGKADAMKNSVAKAKNVDMNPRQSHGTIEAGGIKVRVLGEDSSDFKFKIKNKNK